MEGEQLPKATMNSFLKNHTTSPFSAEYLAKVLYIAKGKDTSILEFVARVADKSNIMCESYQKKTISADHLEAALNVHIQIFSNMDSPTILEISKILKKVSRNRTSSKDKQVKGWRRCSPKTNSNSENEEGCRRQ